MNQLTKVLNATTKISGRTGLLLKAYSPEIFLGLGVAGIITSTVLACKATLKLEATINRSKKRIAKIKETKTENPNYNKDLALAYLKSSGDIVNLYGAAAGLWVLSISCIVGSHTILKSRNLALMAAYKVIEQGFTAYRQRVVEEYGQEVDHQFKHGLYSKQITKIEVDEETGKNKKVKTNMLVGDPNKLSVYARFFDESSNQWSKTPEYNLLFLRGQQNYFNDMLRARGHVFLNEVYDALGIPRTQAGAVVGWCVGVGDNYIDFGIYDNTGKQTNNKDFVNGYERTILLDFNVDGVIYNLI